MLIITPGIITSDEIIVIIKKTALDYLPDAEVLLVIYLLLNPS
jgi:hypothetical protein